jgi:peroxiredoxin-like protein
MATESLPYLYETELQWTEERKGTLNAPGLDSIQVAAPPEFHGHAGMWTPEHFFVASINTCFMTTFLAIAEMSKLDFVSFACIAVGKLDKTEGARYQMTEAVLKPRVVIRHSKDLERTTRILEKAEKNCLISNSLKTKVTLEPESITVAEG